MSRRIFILGFSTEINYNDLWMTPNKIVRNFFRSNDKKESDFECGSEKSKNYKKINSRLKVWSEQWIKYFHEKDLKVN